MIPWFLISSDVQPPAVNFRAFHHLKRNPSLCPPTHTAGLAEVLPLSLPGLVGEGSSVVWTRWLPWSPMLSGSLCALACVSASFLGLKQLLEGGHQGYPTLGCHEESTPSHTSVGLTGASTWECDCPARGPCGNCLRDARLCQCGLTTGQPHHSEGWGPGHPAHHTGSGESSPLVGVQGVTVRV